MGMKLPISSLWEYVLGRSGLHLDSSNAYLCCSLISSNPSVFGYYQFAVYGFTIENWGVGAGGGLLLYNHLPEGEKKKLNLSVKP